MTKKMLVLGAGLILLVGGAWYYFKKISPKSQLSGSNLSQNQKVDIDPATLPGLQTGQAPWGVGLEGLEKRLAVIGLSALRSEGTAMHIHEHLDVYINGNHSTVPAGIGDNEAANFISPIHTHDASGVIHIESPQVKSFTLGQFFDVWGVLLNDDCLGQYCGSDTRKLHVWVNGKEVVGHFRDLVLEPYQEILVAFGDNTSIPSPVPSSFNFPAGL